MAETSKSFVLSIVIQSGQGFELIAALNLNLDNSEYGVPSSHSEFAFLWMGKTLTVQQVEHTFWTCSKSAVGHPVDSK